MYLLANIDYKNWNKERLEIILRIVLCSMHLLPESHHDSFVFANSGEDFHIVVYNTNLLCHGGIVFLSGFYIVICATGRDQPDGSHVIVNFSFCQKNAISLILLLAFFKAYA